MKPAFTRTGIELLGNVPWGTHLSLFYETKQDLFDIVVPYFSAGLEDKEFCLWIVPPSVSQQEALDALKRGVPDFDRHLSEGDIKLVSQDQWYTENGRFELATVIERFREKLKEAISKSYVGLRANGNSAWLQRADPTAFSEYENKLDDLIADEKMIVLCSFSLPESNSALVLDAARSHQLTAALRNSSWEVIETHLAERSNPSEHLIDATDVASHRSAKLATLTPRERAVLAQIAAGASSKESARRLGISPRTVEFHRANMLRKLGAKNTAELVRVVLAA